MHRNALNGYTTHNIIIQLKGFSISVVFSFSIYTQFTWLQHLQNASRFSLTCYRFRYYMFDTQNFKQISVRK